MGAPGGGGGALRTGMEPRRLDESFASSEASELGRRAVVFTVAFTTVVVAVVVVVRPFTLAARGTALVAEDGPAWFAGSWGEMVP